MQSDSWRQEARAAPVSQLKVSVRMAKVGKLDKGVTTD